MGSVVTFQSRQMVIADSSMEATLRVARKAASSNLPVLICGESGTGKELIARYIHEQSPRSQGPFVSLNCAAIPDGLMEAELFGYERGAFTGAISQRIGRFEQADGGTILLDEISEMGIHLQAKLLRVLQEGEIDRLGGRNSVSIRTRVIATTNRDPVEILREETFRKDLFYRLNVLRIDCLPLRGRLQAIESLANSFLIESADQHDREVSGFSAGAMEKMLSHTWPGNIRELKNVVERAVVMAEGSSISEAEVEIFALASNPMGQSTLGDIEKSHILQTLQQTQGNRNEAARALGITTRTLRNKLREYDKR